MIDFAEHIYDDDPNRGHPDVRTDLEDTSYFFLGNGHILTAIQYAKGGQGSQYGLLIMNPEVLGKKRDALTFYPENGLEHTMLRVYDHTTRQDIPLDKLSVQWSKADVPTVQVTTQHGPLQVTEKFYCPDNESSQLARTIHLLNQSSEAVNVTISLWLPDEEVRLELRLSSGATRETGFLYDLDSEQNVLKFDMDSSLAISENTREYWQNVSKFESGSGLLNHFVQTATTQLFSVMSKSGVVDASIWQYNREWVRDHGFMVQGLVLGGHHALAKTLLQRLLDDFVTDDGDTIDSSEKRNPDEVELDQNGILLNTIRLYVDWTGDFDFVANNWKRIRAVADYPLREVFVHPPSGLLANCREFWERHAAHGIEPGIELIYNVYCSIGLNDAAALAEMMGEKDAATRWRQASESLKNALLNNPVYAMHNETGFVKRKDLVGNVQRTIVASEVDDLPEAVPLRAEKEHFLDPDTSFALPIALGFINPHSDLSKKTLANLEMLWNQAWDHGGYGRYHFSSEPDSAGPWPFASLFIARAYAEAGEYDKVWRILNWINKMPGADAGSWFEYYGDRFAPPFPQIGIIPWTWAEILLLIYRHILGMEVTGDRIRFHPHILPDLGNIKVAIPFRTSTIHMHFTPGKEFAATGDTVFDVVADGVFEFRYEGKDVVIRVEYPDW